MSTWKEIKGLCPACGHRGWCTVSADGEAVLCRRNSAGKRKDQADGTPAYLFRAAELAGVGAIASKPKKEQPRLTTTEVRALIKQHRTAINPPRLDRLAERLGVRRSSLEAYGIGWDTKAGAWSFPMYSGDVDTKGRPIPCGLRLRSDDGTRKACVVGSRNGIFVPEDFDATAGGCDSLGVEAPLCLLLPEGPTDCAAARDLGFRAIGRPNNSGGGEQIRALFGRLPPQEIVVVGEWDGPKWVSGTADWPGISGAMQLCERLVGVGKPLRFIMPPAGMKDIRAGVIGGLTQADVLELVMRAQPVTAEYLRYAWAKYRRRQDAARAKAVKPTPATVAA